MRFQIIEVTDRRSIQRIRNFRAQVRKEEGHLSQSDINELMFDEHDNDARHWMTQSKGEMIAARLSLCSSILKASKSKMLIPFEQLIPTPLGYLSRLVVRSDFRGKGIGKQMTCIRMQQAYESGLKQLLFYQRGGLKLS